MAKNIYCGAKTVPKNKQIGNMKECAEKNQVRLYGLNRIDPNLLTKSKTKKMTQASFDKIKIKTIGMRARVKNLEKQLDDKKLSIENRKKLEDELNKTRVEYEKLNEQLINVKELQSKQRGQGIDDGIYKLGLTLNEVQKNKLIQAVHSQTDCQLRITKRQLTNSEDYILLNESQKQIAEKIFSDGRPRMIKLSAKQVQQNFQHGEGILDSLRSAWNSVKSGFNSASNYVGNTYNNAKNYAITKYNQFTNQTQSQKPNFQNTPEARILQTSKNVKDPWHYDPEYQKSYRSPLKGPSSSTVQYKTGYEPKTNVKQSFDEWINSAMSY